MITQKDIAEQLGLSQQLVSLAFSAPEKINKKTCKHILKLAEELDYRPSAYARAMRLGRFNNVTLVASNRKGKINASQDLIHGIQTGLAKARLHLTLAYLADQKLTNQKYMPRILNEWMADGLLINYTIRPPLSMCKIIEKHNIPSIWVMARRKTDCVYADFYRAGQEAVERLAELGHKKIAFTDYSCIDHHSTFDMMNGYKDAMRKAGLKTVLVGTDKRLPRRRRTGAAMKVLIAPDRPTALIVFTTMTLLPVLQALAKLQLSSPKDISLIVISDHLYDDPGIAVSSLVVPYFEMGKTAVDLLKEKITNPKKKLKPVVLPIKFFDGQTCGPSPEKPPKL